jgi:nitroreductase
MTRPLILAVVLILVAPVPAWAQAPADVALPPPHMDGGKPLMQALKERHSTREFADRGIPAQILSDLLWAAAGFNRPAEGKRTAPSALDWQEVHVYVVLPSGAYLYDAKGNSLRGVAGGDLRKLAGTQDFVATAPLNLVYVADTTKMTRVAATERAMFSGADTAFISENAYLYCASEGLATVVRASVDRTSLAKALKLADSQTITLAQTVGYPVESGK